MSVSLNTGERKDDRIILTAISHVTSPIHPPWGVSGQFSHAAGGTRPCVLWSSALSWAYEPEHAWRIDPILTGCQSPRDTAGKKQLSVSVKVSAAPVLIWERLNTGNCHQIFNFTKASADGDEVCMRVWIC